MSDGNDGGKILIHNPILPGFCPDPSIIRVEEDYYIAVSTFEWWPGVRIYHSKDLEHFEQLASPLNRVSQLNMVGNPDSCGVWAPDISWDGEYYWLIYTDVKTRNGGLFNTHNYLVKSRNIRGGWSEPVYINSSGFDPSLFHDTDGKKYVVNMINGFHGILVQEYDSARECLVGNPRNIYPGTGRDFTEGPHIYHIGEYYYLLMAEGGTSYEHMVTMARSRSIWGPYEADPGNPILTSDVENPDALQKCGHADIVCTQNGEWYMVHLGSRPPHGTRQCVLGRETSIQKVVWNKEKWLRLACGGRYAQYETERPTGISKCVLPQEKKDGGRDDFETEMKEKGQMEKGNVLGQQSLCQNSLDLGIQYTSLREPYDGFATLKERQGYLRLYGQESLNSCFHVSLIARRQQARLVQVDTCLEFIPTCREQAAGLAYLYDTRNFYLLVKTRQEKIGDTPRETILHLMKSCNGDVTEVTSRVLPAKNIPLYLRAVTIRDGLYVQFFYSLNGLNYLKLAEVPTDILTDEHCIGFTGAHFGMYCHDMTGQRQYADFDYFEIRESDVYGNEIH